MSSENNDSNNQGGVWGFMNTAWGKAKDGGNYVYDKARDPEFHEQVKEGAGNVWEKTKEGAIFVKDTVTDPEFQNTVKENVYAGYENTKHYAKQGYEYGKVVGQDLLKKDDNRGGE